MGRGVRRPKTRARLTRITIARRRLKPRTGSFRLPSIVFQGNLDRGERVDAREQRRELLERHPSRVFLAPSHLSQLPERFRDQLIEVFLRNRASDQVSRDGF